MAHTHKFVATLALAGLVAVASPACAQTYGHGGYARYPDGGYARDIERRAYDRGFREGLENGRDDARHDRRYSFERHGEWRDADNGYHRGDGDREFYRRSYRAGFQAGYNEAFNRFARRDRDWRR